MVRRQLVLPVGAETVAPRVTAVKVDSASPSVFNQTERPAVTAAPVVPLVLEAQPHRALLVAAVMVALAATVEAEDSRLVRATVATVATVALVELAERVETRAVASTEVAATAAPPALVDPVRMPERWCPVRTVVSAATEARRELAGIRVRSETVAVAARPARTALRHRVVSAATAAPVRVLVLVAKQWAVPEVAVVPHRMERAGPGVTAGTQRAPVSPARQRVVPAVMEVQPRTASQATVAAVDLAKQRVLVQRRPMVVPAETVVRLSTPEQ